MQRLLDRIDKFIPPILALASFILYLRTLAPDVVDADGGEFQFAAWNFSFVHPTGYPLYLILGGIFQHLVPFGNPAYRLNLFTAITAALAVAAVYLAANEITHHRSAAIVATLSFAVTRTFWYDASAAETYDLNAFFVALLIYLALRWQSQSNAKTFAAFCFTFGLALTHHRTIVLWLPAFVLFFIVVGWDRFRSFRFQVSSSNLLRFTFYFLLPLLLYLYIPLRAPASPYATLTLVPGHALTLYDNSFTGFVNYLLGRVFQNEIVWDAVSVARLASVPQLLFDQFGMIGVILGVIGFVAMIGRREWARTVLLLGSFAVVILFASVYHIGDIFHYYIPAYLVWALGIGVGLSALVDLIARRLPVDRRQLLAAFCFLLSAFLLLVLQFIANFPYADRSHETQEREQWTRTLRMSESIPPNAILISNDRDEMMPLWYMQYVENVRRDIVGLFPIITPAPEHANVVRLTDSVVDSGRPIFFVKPMPGIEIKYQVVAADGLWRVLGRASDLLSTYASDAVLADQVRVRGYDVERSADGLRVAIYWQPQSKLDANYTTFIHLLDANGNKVAQGNDHQVGGEFYSTSMWTSGETLRDEQIITLPPDLPGSYHVLVGMYRQPDSEMLGEPVEIGTIKLP